MIEEIDPAEWLGLPSPAEMWEQQAHLVEEECHLLRETLAEQRQRLAKMIQMYTEADLDRAALRKQLAAQGQHLEKLRLDLSRAHREGAADWKWRQTAITSYQQVYRALAESVRANGGDPDPILDLYSVDSQYLTVHMHRGLEDEELGQPQKEG